jgi:short-subunit dehydrogenase
MPTPRPTGDSAGNATGDLARIRTALVTGATAGIGNAFARALAAGGSRLVLVARDSARLDAVAEQLKTAHRVDVEVLTADLADREQLERVAVRLRDGTRPVDLLVNNAGFGLKQRFVGGDLATEERALDVMARAVLVLSHAALPGMVSRGRGALVNVSSVAGFLPSGTYSAAKAWTTAFTMSLAGELAGTGVTATALCPGYVHTEFHGRANIRTGRLPEFVWLDPDQLVASCLTDVARGRSLSVPSLQYKLAVTAMRHLPLPVVAWFSRGRMRRRAR